MAMGISQAETCSLTTNQFAFYCHIIWVNEAPLKYILVVPKWRLVKWICYFTRFAGFPKVPVAFNCLLFVFPVHHFSFVKYCNQTGFHSLSDWLVHGPQTVHYTDQWLLLPLQPSWYFNCVVGTLLFVIEPLQQTKRIGVRWQNLLAADMAHNLLSILMVISATCIPQLQHKMF